MKSPWICDYIEEIAADPGIAIDFAILPMRVLEAAAESRREVEKSSEGEPSIRDLDDTPGGLWHTKNPMQQEDVLARQFHRLCVGLARMGAVVILVHYPRLTRDPRYLFDKLRPLLADSCSYTRFQEVFARTVDNSLVHRFTDDDQ